MADNSTSRPWEKPSSGGAAGQVSELKSLVVGYAKQETVDPLKTLGRYLGFGFAGSVAIGTGLALLLLALLRWLQTLEVFNESGHLDGGTFGWAPYLITGATGAILAGLFLWRLFTMANKRGSA